MYTIAQAARRTGVPATSLRAWERRYGVVVPSRNSAGYRVYDDDALAVLSTMRRLLDDGWTPVLAATAIRESKVPVEFSVSTSMLTSDGATDAAPDTSSQASSDTTVDTAPVLVPGDPGADGASYRKAFLDAAMRLDVSSLEAALDAAFALGSFEHVVDTWLSATLTAVGDLWALGELDVASEHVASHVVHTRLAAAFAASASRARGPAVVVGLPPGSQHELGALAFATAARRRGLDVLYLGPNVPVDSWVSAVQRHRARAAVVAVTTSDDRSSLQEVVRGLRAMPETMVCAGGAAEHQLTRGVRPLTGTISEAARELDQMLSA
jgi:methanogenic corrinoid protein MtbC1